MKALGTGAVTGSLARPGRVTRETLLQSWHVLPRTDKGCTQRKCTRRQAILHPIRRLHDAAWRTYFDTHVSGTSPSPATVVWGCRACTRMREQAAVTAGSGASRALECTSGGIARGEQGHVSADKHPSRELCGPWANTQATGGADW